MILGKTNLSEWANFRSSHSISGWSGRGRQTLESLRTRSEPKRLQLRFGAGGVRQFLRAGSGHRNGRIGHGAGFYKRRGWNQAHCWFGGTGRHHSDFAQPGHGWTTRPHGSGCRNSLAAMAEPGKLKEGYTKFLDPNGLKGARLGVERKFFGANAEMDRLMEECLAEMKRQGALLVDPANLPSHGKYDEDEMEVLLYEFKADLNKYLSALGPKARVHSLADVIQFNRDHRHEEMPYFEQEIMERAEKKGPLTEKAYLDARANGVRLSRAEGIDAVMAKYKVEAIVAPTCAPASLNDFVLGDAGGLPACTTPAAVAGYPHITVPAGLVRGLPVGISFFGTAYSEPVLLKLAYSFEQATKHAAVPDSAPRRK